MVSTASSGQGSERLVEMAADATGSSTQVLDDQSALRRVATTVAEGATAIEQARCSISTPKKHELAIFRSSPRIAPGRCWEH